MSEDDTAVVVKEAMRLAAEGNFDQAVERLYGHSPADPDERRALEEARARIEEQRGIGQA